MHPLAVLAAHTPESARPSEDARARLLQAGLKLFAQQGFDKTSTRELTDAASVNIASISYYFGDKAGLYRAVFSAASGAPEDHIALYAGRQLTLAEALQGFYAGFLEPLKQGDTARLCIKLHFREMVEPTGLWEARDAQGTQDAHGIKPLHDALVALLCRHLGLRKADTALNRLAICLAGLGVQLHVCLDLNDQLLPGITDGAEALDGWAKQLPMFGLAMVQAEAQRRGVTLSGDQLR